MQNIFKVGALAIALVAAMIRESAADDSVSDLQVFRDKIVPLLVEKCLGCHGGEATEGGYSVADTSRLFQPGDSGQSPISLEKSEPGELLARLMSADSTLRMPLDAEPLELTEIETVRQWLSSGAKVDDRQRPTSLVEIYGQTKASARAPSHYSTSLPISSLLLNQDGRLLLVGGYSEILIWNTDRQLLDFRLSIRGRMISDMKWAPSGKLVVASGAPGKFGVLEAFDFATREPIAAFGFSRDVCSSIAASPYRNEMAAGFADGSVTLFSLDEFRPRVTSVPHAAGVTNVEWSSKNDRIFSASLDRTAKSFESEDAHVLFAYSDHERSVGSVINTQFGPVTLDETGALRLWSEGDEVRTVAKLEGFPQRMQRMVTSNGVVFVADKDRIRRIYIIQDEVDDEKAKDTDKDKVEQKPKKKKRTRFKEMEALQSVPNRQILSMSTNGNGFVVAGLDNGHVAIWRTADSTSPWKTWNAQP